MIQKLVLVCLSLLLSSLSYLFSDCSGLIPKRSWTWGLLEPAFLMGFWNGMEDISVRRLKALS